MKTSEGLAKAAEVMAERGHTRRSFITLRGVCAMGALFIANGGEVVDVTLKDKLIGFSIRTDVPGYDSNGTVECTKMLRSFLDDNAERFGWKAADPFEGVPEWNDRVDYSVVHTAFVEAAEFAKQFETE